MQQGNFFQKYWLDIVCGFVVIVATARISIELPSLTANKYWVLVIFSVAVWLSCAYEITIKRCVQERISKKIILFKFIIIWVIPLLIGYGVSIICSRF